MVCLAYPVLLFPEVVATALDIDGTPTYTVPHDVAQLGTIWLGYIPSDQVATLASLISNKKSLFYMLSSASIPMQVDSTPKDT